MILFTRQLKLTVAGVCGLTVCAHGAQAPQIISISQLSTTVEDVVVPLPNEIFGALKSVKKVNEITTRLGNDIVKKRLRNFE